MMPKLVHATVTGKWDQNIVLCHNMTGLNYYMFPIFSLAVLRHLSGLLVRVLISYVEAGGSNLAGRTPVTEL